MSQRNCWLRFRRHRFRETTGFRFGGRWAWPGLDSGTVLRCRVCGHETCAVGERLDRLTEIGGRP